MSEPGTGEKRHATAKRVLDICRSRGLSIVQLPSGQLAFRGNKSNVTPELVAAAKQFKEEIAKQLGLNPPPSPVNEAKERRSIEVRFGTGLISHKLTPDGQWDVGAGWWRFAGDEEWQRIPGREHIKLLTRDDEFPLP